MSDPSLADINSEYDGWVKNYEITSGSNLSCNAASHYTEDKIDVSTGYIEGGNKRMFDYYVCGGSAEGLATYGDNDPDDCAKQKNSINETCQCYGVDINKWRDLYENCLKDPNGEDECYNMAIDSTQNVSTFTMGEFSTAEDKYNPLIDFETDFQDRTFPLGNIAPNVGCHQCKDGKVGTCDEEECWIGHFKQSLVPAGMASYLNIVRPAFPVNYVPFLNDLYNRQKWSDADDEEDLQSCPEGFTRRNHTCFTDGYPAPGCGSGGDGNPEVGNDSDAVKFCSRDSDHYEKSNIAECCLSVEDDNDRFSRCPTKFCKSQKKLEDLTAEGHSCSRPFMIGEEQYCNVLSDTCNSFFEEHCHQEQFLDTEDPMHGSCSTWANISPGKFAEFASGICVPTEEMLNGAKTDSVKQRNLKKLFQNPLCRNYMVNNLGIYVESLDKMCAGSGEEGDERIQAIKKTGEGENEKWEYTTYGDNMKDICACYLPDEYYDWYKDNELQGDKTNLSLETKPQCFHTGCQRTLLYDTSSAGSGCPDLQMCFQSIEQNITVRDGNNLHLGSEGDFPSQSCNFSNVSSTRVAEAGGDLPSQTAGSPAAAADQTADAAAAAAGAQSSSTPSSSSSSSDDMDVYMGVGAVICIFICIIAFMYMNAESGNSGA